jgi:hypothetical protein
MPVTRSLSPLRTGCAERACQFSLNARTLPRSAKSSSATALAPIIASRPVLTRNRRARIADPKPTENSSADATAVAAMIGIDTRYPGRSESNNMIEPATKAMTPPTPSTPTVGVTTSATMSPMPTTSNAKPA